MTDAPMRFTDRRSRTRLVTAGRIPRKASTDRPWETPPRERILIHVSRKALEV